MNAKIFLVAPMLLAMGVGPGRRARGSNSKRQPRRRESTE